MKIRDEADVIGHNLRYHLAQGVDEFIVTDNGSTDGTLEVLRRYEAAGLLRLIEEPGRDFRREAHGWVTRMARLAATEMEADWVVHADADEFWFPVGGSLREVLATIPEGYGVVLAPRPEFVARPDGPGDFADRLTVREARSRLRPKIAHRADPQATLHRGAHDVDVERGEGVRHAGRAVMRAVKEDRYADDDGLTWAPIFPARVLHLPIRSFEQYKRRVETTIFHGGFEDKAHDELREQYEAGRLPELYERLTVVDEDLEAGITDGELVRDERLSERLARCPDPTAPESGAGGGERAGGGVAPTQGLGPAAQDAAGHGAGPGTEPVEEELREIELDAMATLARTQRSLIRQLDSHRARAERQRRRLRRMRRQQGGALRKLTARVRRESSR
jgi:hypothetical protein